MSKHLLHKYESKVRQTMIDACQFAVSVAVGAETPIHMRETIETTICASREMEI